MDGLLFSLSLSLSLSLRSLTIAIPKARPAVSDLLEPALIHRQQKQLLPVISRIPCIVSPPSPRPGAGCKPDLEEDINEGDADARRRGQGRKKEKPTQATKKSVSARLSVHLCPASYCCRCVSAHVIVTFRVGPDTNADIRFLWPISTIVLVFSGTMTKVCQRQCDRQQFFIH